MQAEPKTVTPQVFATPVMLDIDLIAPNTYNPNVVPDALFGEIVNDIRKNGFVGAIVVRATGSYPGKPDAYEIVDGEHRWRAAKQLGYKQIPCIVRTYDDDTARFNTFRWNHERGFFDSVKTADLIRDLNKRHTLDELVQDLGMAKEEMIQYLRPSEVPKSWDMPVAPNPDAEPMDREPLTFFLPAKEKDIVMERLQDVAKKANLDINNALFEVVAGNYALPLIDVKIVRQSLEYFAKNHPEYREQVQETLKRDLPEPENPGKSSKMEEGSKRPSRTGKKSRNAAS